MQFLDSSVWLDHLANTSQDSSDVVNSDTLLFCSILSLFEIKKRIIKLGFSTEKVANSLSFIRNRSIIVNLTEEIIDSAVEISITHNLAHIDSLIYASALSVEAELITADNDFRNLERVRIIKK